MDLILNLGLAWVSVILAFALAIIFAMRKLIRKNTRLKETLQRMNRFLRKHHKVLGIALIITGLIHGLFSSEPVWTLNLGTVSWVLSILLGLNWLFKKQLGGKKGWMFYHRLLTLAFTAFLILHVVDVGIQAPQILMSTISPTSEVKLNVGSGALSTAQQQFAGVTLKDGTYRGEATGYRAGLVVEVVVRSGAITSIQVVSHNEVNSRFYAKPIQLIPQEIIDSQSLDVDTVAGATRTSVGIINAVNNALTGAVSSGTLAPTETLPQNNGKGEGGKPGRH